jgi:CheY-like chemotaxis protein
VALLETQRVDLVLMDIQMPVLDGYAATRQVRERESRLRLPRVPIVALTANAFDEDAAQSMAAGMDAHLAKPYSREQLRDLLQALVVGLGRKPLRPAGRRAPRRTSTAWGPAGLRLHQQQALEDQRVHGLEGQVGDGGELDRGAAGHQQHRFGAGAHCSRRYWRSMAPAIAWAPPLISASLVLVGKSTTSPVGTFRPAVPISSARSMSAEAGQDQAAEEAAVGVERVHRDRGADHHHQRRPRRRRWPARANGRPASATQRSAPRRLGWS